MFFSRKGQISMYIFFVIFAVVLILIGSIIAPFGVLFSSEMYVAGEDILLMANQTASEISDPAIRDLLLGYIGEGVSAQTTNVQISSDLYQYSWIIVLVLAGLFIFMYTRRLVEVRGGGGFV